MQVLLVEDEPSIAEPLVSALEREGHDVVHAATGTDAVRLEADGTFDIVLLDLRLPDIDGFDVCRAIRTTSTVPIIIVSARGEDIDMVLGLELGADDYLVKPFGVRVLLARMGAVLRRRMPSTTDEQPASEVLDVGGLRIDLRAHKVSVDARDVELTPTEFALLEAFARRPGAAWSRDQLLADVWETSWTGSTKTVDVHVASLRRKLGDAVTIETIRGIGYRLVAQP